MDRHNAHFPSLAFSNRILSLFAGGVRFLRLACLTVMSKPAGWAAVQKGEKKVGGCLLWSPQPMLRAKTASSFRFLDFSCSSSFDLSACNSIPSRSSSEVGTIDTWPSHGSGAWQRQGPRRRWEGIRYAIMRGRLSCPLSSSKWRADLLRRKYLSGI
ncbi:hypothetical protein LY78DRAFT_496605 [Colletotrichum sublineola]|nr:hypothetical protein LY78DRAFT_496605 [Colletotrichum sublineola]